MIRQCKACPYVVSFEFLSLRVFTHNSRLTTQNCLSGGVQELVDGADE